MSKTKFLPQYWLFCFLFFVAALIPYFSFAAPQLEEQNYFASFRANKVNVRAGPSQDYPIKFTFKLYGIPVKVISSYDNWNEIKDFEGETGWVNQNLLTKKRTVITKTKAKNNYVKLFAVARHDSKILLMMENNVVADFLKCDQKWCIVKVEGKKGWLERDQIWGIDERD